MNAYEPSNAVTVAWILSVLLAVPVLTWAISQSGSRLAAWSFVMATTWIVDTLANTEPSGIRMVLLVVTIWFSCKAVAGVEAQRNGSLPPPWPWLGFSLLWMGMRPAVFSAPPRWRPDAGRVVIRGMVWFMAGLVLLALARLLWHTTTNWSEPARLIVVTAVTLPALSMMLHFGVINVMAGLWRAVGYDCRPLFRAPLRSQSLTEFWGWRWNAAFTELLTPSVYRPVRTRLSQAWATFSVFFVSGLIHEAAISLPVRAGYGLPTLYFTFHGCLVLLERRLDLAGAWGRVWTLAWLVLSLPLCFHPWFLAGTVWPLIGIDY